MKILIINTLAIDFNGVTDCIFRYLEAIDCSNMTISILSTMKRNEIMVGKFKALGCKIEYLEIRKQKILQYIVKLAQLVKKEKYDIVHVHGNSATMTFDLIGAMLGGCKIRIAHSHNTTCGHIKTDKLLRPLFYKTYTTGFACGIAAGNWLFQNREFTVIPNGRNLEELQFDGGLRKKMRQKLQLENKFVIGHVGRFNIQKNHTFLLKVFTEIYKLHEAVELVLMGDGALMQEVIEEAKQLGIFENIIFTGSIDNVPEMLNAMDVMVLPSLYEGLPLVVLEWQANGLPCYISDQITKECIVNDNVSVLSLNEEPQYWAKEIVKAPIINRSINSEFIKDNLQIAGYDIKSNANHLKNIYLKLVNEL